MRSIGQAPGGSRADAQLTACYERMMPILGRPAEPCLVLHFRGHPRGVTLPAWTMLDGTVDVMPELGVLVQAALNDQHAFADFCGPGQRGILVEQRRAILAARTICPGRPLLLDASVTGVIALLGQVERAHVKRYAWAASFTPPTNDNFGLPENFNLEFYLRNVVRGCHVLTSGERMVCGGPWARDLLQVANSVLRAAALASEVGRDA